MPVLNDKVLSLTDKEPIKLTKMQGWPSGHYKLSPDHVGAIQAAYFSKRPLLVRGGPGLGKSQLAQTVASILDWGLISTVVHYNTTMDELLYSVDHVKRLDEANRPKSTVKKLSKYLQPGKVWQAIAPDTLRRYGKIRPHQKTGTVLLIDEIDKADSTLPNALLEVLANGALSVPYLDDAICSNENHPYFVVITSNDERLLPQAFLRRCAVLDIQLPDEKTKVIEWMMGIFRTHYPEKKQQTDLTKLAEKVADKVWEHRNQVKQKNNGDYLAGTSEFLDMLRTLLCFSAEERDEKLTILSECLIEKSQLRKNHA